MGCKKDIKTAIYKGERVLISEAKTRRIYECIGCGKDLIAKKGDIIKHHYAHKSIDDENECNGESIQHIFGKDIILKYYKRLIFNYKCKECHKPFRIKFEKDDKSQLEFPLDKKDNYFGRIVADVCILENNSVKCVIEVFHTHKTDYKKIQNILSRGYKYIEVSTDTLDKIWNLLEDKENPNRKVNVSCVDTDLCEGCIKECKGDCYHKGNYYSGWGIFKYRNVICRDQCIKMRCNKCKEDIPEKWLQNGICTTCLNNLDEYTIEEVKEDEIECIDYE
jgi:hypothetical protein